jgi:hypothetical protein
VREYRTRYPDKAVTYYADLHCRSTRDGWAVLMGGGSLPNLPALPDELAQAIVRFQPSDLLPPAPGQWCLADGDRELLVYCATDPPSQTIAVPAGPAYRFAAIDPATGRLKGSFESVVEGRIPIDQAPAVIWVRR